MNIIFELSPLYAPAAAKAQAGVGMAGLRISLDLNRLFRDAIDSTQGPVGVAVVFCLIALLMAPWLIPAVSRAIAEQRKLTHQREQNLLKIRNSRADRLTSAKRSTRAGGGDGGSDPGTERE